MITVRLYRNTGPGLTWDEYVALKIEATAWCQRNLPKDDFRVTSNHHVIFDRQEDAVAFKLAFNL